MIFRRIPVFIAALILFAALAKGAHDLWAATAVHLAVLVIFVLMLFYKQIKSDTLFLPLAPLAAVVLVAGFFSFKRSVNPSESFLALTDVAAAVLMFYAAANVFDQDKSEDVLLRWMVPGLWIQTVLSAVGAQPLINPNVAAAFVLFWIPSLKMKWMAALTRNDKYYWGSGLIASAAVLFLAQSVWAWVLLLVAAIVFFRTNLKPVHWLVLGTLIVGLLVMKLRPTSASLDRLYWWKAAGTMFVHHPILGVGLGNFTSAFPAYKTGEVLGTRFAHSWLAALLAETGILGTAAVLAFFAAWWSAARQSLGMFASLKPMKAGIVLFLLYTLVSLGTEYLVNLLTLAVFMGILAGRSGVGWRLPLRRSGVIVAAALAVAAVPDLVAPFLASRHIVDGQDYLRQGDWASADRHFGLAAGLDARAWEPYQGRALAAVQQFEKTKDWNFMQRAVEFQAQAVERNKLDPVLARDLRQYSDLVRQP